MPVYYDECYCKVYDSSSSLLCDLTDYKPLGLLELFRFLTLCEELREVEPLFCESTVLRFIYFVGDIFFSIRFVEA